MSDESMILQVYNILRLTREHDQLALELNIIPELLSQVLLETLDVDQEFESLKDGNISKEAFKAAIDKVEDKQKINQREDILLKMIDLLPEENHGKQ